MLTQAGEHAILRAIRAAVKWGVEPQPVLPGLLTFYRRLEMSPGDWQLQRRERP